MLGVIFFGDFALRKSDVDSWGLAGDEDYSKMSSLPSPACLVSLAFPFALFLCLLCIKHLVVRRMEEGNEASNGSGPEQPPVACEDRADSGSAPNQSQDEANVDSVKRQHVSLPNIVINDDIWTKPETGSRYEDVKPIAASHSSSLCRPSSSTHFMYPEDDNWENIKDTLQKIKKKRNR